MRSRSTWILPLVCPILLIFSVAPPGFATVFTVTSLADSGAGSLRDAVASSTSGDTINFSVTGTIALSGGVIAITDDITISGPGASSLAISGSSLSQVFHIVGTVSISGLTLENANNFFGGAILNEGVLTLDNCVISNNTTGGLGGAIWNNTTLTVNSSTFSNNSAQLFGGAIANFGTANVLNSTFFGNIAHNDSLFAQGGAIWNAATANLSNITVAMNSADAGGSGVFNGGGTMTLKGSLLSANLDGTPAPDNCLDESGGGLLSAGYNLSDDGTCSTAFTMTGDANNTAADLDPAGLADNGGPTPTVALLQTSPAIDAIPIANCTDVLGNTIAADQRGVSRPQGAGCDIGAFEFTATSIPFSAFTAKLELESDSESEFELNSSFTLGANSDGIDPLSEPITLTIAGYSVTIPPGSFQQLTGGKKAGSFVYEGTIDGVELEVQIVPLGNNTYQFKAEGEPVDFGAISNPVTVMLVIGNDTGSTSINAEF
jgi:hypothetical protein